jgi:hypothetical protein
MLECERHLCRPGAVLIKGASSALHQPTACCSVQADTAVSDLNHLAILRFSTAVKQVAQYSYREAWPANPDHGGFESVPCHPFCVQHTDIHPTKVCFLTDCQVAGSFHLQQLSLPDQCWTVTLFSHQHNLACCKPRTPPSQAAALKG